MPLGMGWRLLCKILSTIVSIQWIVDWIGNMIDVAIHSFMLIKFFFCLFTFCIVRCLLFSLYSLFFLFLCFSLTLFLFPFLSLSPSLLLSFSLLIFVSLFPLIFHLFRNELTYMEMLVPLKVKLCIKFSSEACYIVFPIQSAQKLHTFVY